MKAPGSKADPVASHIHQKDEKSLSPYERASLLSRITFSWAGPLLKTGASRPLDEGDATFLVPKDDDAAVLAHQFEQRYQKLQKHYAEKSITANTTGWTLLSLHWPRMFEQSVWVIVEIGVR